MLKNIVPTFEKVSILLCTGLGWDFLIPPLVRYTLYYLHEIPISVITRVWVCLHETRYIWCKYHFNYGHRSTN